MIELKQKEMKLKSIALTLVALIGLSFASNAQKTVVDIAVGSADHTTLVAAVKAAGLVETLQSAGPFTVFAPVNAAFAKLPAGTVDYLLKPIGFQRFFQAVQKAKSAYTSQLTQEVKTLKEEDIYIKQGDTFIRIVWSDILYVEAMQNYVKIHLQDKTHLVHQSMNATVEMLPNSVFFRIHKSYLVNLFHINSINGGRVYVKNYELPLSKYRREELFDTVVNKKLLSK